MSAHVRHLALVGLVGAALSSPLAAQQATPAPETAALTPSAEAAALVAPAAPAATAAPAARPAESSGPSMQATSVALRPQSQPATTATVAAQRAGLGTAKAQMIVGAAAFVAGAIIGGDPGVILMVGGAGLGLWGLYNYLQ